MSKLTKSFVVFRYLSIVVLLISLSSCSIYKQQFDCPPPSGIPCASVTEIEAMIVETSKGPDLLVPPEKKEDHCFWCGQKQTGSHSSLKASTENRKVWMCSKRIEGALIQGHYLEKKGTCSPHFEECVLEPEDAFPPAGLHQNWED